MVLVNFNPTLTKNSFGNKTNH